MSFPAFDLAVARDGYAWWYLDALSDDGRHALTLIAFVGSVFSPYYARARRRGRGDPLEHCAINVAVYGPGGRWTMTERGSTAVARSPGRLAIGPSALAFDGTTLRAELAEIAAPLPRPLRGTLHVRPAALTGHTERLDESGRHRWSPVAPAARIDVDLQRPGLRWSGNAYVDHNAGDEPLEAGFREWHWSRATRSSDGSTAVLYDMQRRAGGRRVLALRFAPDGAVRSFDAPAEATLPRTGWRVARATRTEDGRARVVETLEDTPFYARSLVEGRLLGETVLGVHESLSLERFSRRWVQVLLPFRMPRRPG